MPLNPDYRPAFQGDEERARTDAARQKQHAQRIRDQTAERTRDRSRDGFLDRAVIKAPLQGAYRNGTLVLWMTPPEASIAGEVAAIAATKSFALSDATSGGTVTLRVKAGFLDSTSFDEVVTTIVADGVVYLKTTVSIVDDTWTVTNRERIVAAGDIPANTANEFYFPLGAYHLDAGVLVIDTGEAGKGDQIFELNHCPNFYTFPLTYGDRPTWSPG